MSRRDGSPLWVNAWIRPMLGEDGRPQAAHSIWVDVTDRVLAQAESARLAEQNLYLQQEIKSVHNFEEIVGRSPALAAVLDKVRRVAPTDATVLIYGETGTGKELIARAIHSASQRSDKPLIKINCAALPAGLVESELFGHEKGAFTGAIARRTGRFELADGGTIFLDEIGELPADTQAKLLRVLQEREFDRVGGTDAEEGRRPGDRRDQSRPAQGRPREGVPRRPVLPPQRLPDPAPAAPRARPRTSRSWRCSSSRNLPCGSAGGSRGSTPSTLRTARGLSVAGQRPRAGKHPRASGDPPPAATRRRSRVLGHPVAGADGHGASLPGGNREKPHPPRPGADSVGHRRPAGAAAILGLHPNTLRSRLKKLGLSRPAHERS